MKNWSVFPILLLILTGLLPSYTRAEAALPPVAADVTTALTNLKSTESAAREAAFDIIAKQGDARLVPALRAYRDGQLLLRDGRLMRFGERVTVAGAKTPMLPLVDAITGEPITGADSKPILLEKIDLTGAIRAPRGVEKGKLADLISALSLNDPDPVRRKEAIFGAADRTDEALLPALKQQLLASPRGPFSTDLQESIARIELAKGTRDAKLAAIKTLTEVRSSRALASLERAAGDKANAGDGELMSNLKDAIASNQSYQSRVRFVEYSFQGLSAGSILIMLALGLAIIFGLMGVINMAHGEFMMVGAFTTYVIATFFKTNLPQYFDWYPLFAFPGAFLVAGAVGWLCELTVIRHLYGRPLETLLATWGIGLILIQLARVWFGDTLSYAPPSWMSGGWEIARDLVLPKNRVLIIGFCCFCIGLVFFVVRKTKLGLRLRATTQNREMAAALGVPTRRVDAMTFAFGTGLAGMAGVMVPLFDKINPQMGQGYIVDSFLVVVTGGVGNLLGVICTGAGLGFLSKYLEPLIGGTGGSIYAKITILGLIILFLNFRPSGLFPAKGRMADG